jgi:hypothetical protein
MHAEPLPVAMRRTDFFRFSISELCEWMVVGIAVDIAQADYDACFFEYAGISRWLVLYHRYIGKIILVGVLYGQILLAS